MTLSGSPGIDYLDQRFAEYLDEQTESISENVEASVFGHVAEAFLETGTDTWHRKTVEWFMVYLLSEISVTPHNIRQGRSAISILNAYKEIGHMLVSRLRRTVQAAFNPCVETKEEGSLEAKRNREYCAQVPGLHRRAESNKVRHG